MKFWRGFWLRNWPGVILVLVVFALLVVILVSCAAPGPARQYTPAQQVWLEGVNIQRIYDVRAGVICYRATDALACLPAAQTTLNR